MGSTLKDTQLIISDKTLGMVEAIGQVFPHARYQRCTVHFYHNVFCVTPNKHIKEVTKMLKAIHAQEDKSVAIEKAKAVEAKLRKMKLSKAADIVHNGIAETLTHMDFPTEHWMRIRTNNTLERLNREIKRRTKVVGKPRCWSAQGSAMSQAMNGPASAISTCIIRGSFLMSEIFNMGSKIPILVSKLNTLKR